MSLRTILFWMHLAAGCVAGLVILVMSVTGVLLTYDRQLAASADRGPHRAAPPPGAARLTPDALLARFTEQKGALPPGATLTLRSDPTEPAELNLGRDGVVYLNAYDGRVLGRPNADHHQFFQRIVAWHRWLGADGPGRATGKAITGACNLAFFFIVLSGAYLWLPKFFTWQHLRPIVWFKPGLSGKARDFNWHNTAGVWMAIPLALVVFGAMPISYQWANNLVYRIAGSEVPAPAPPPPATNANSQPPAERPRLDALVAAAERKVAGWQSVSFRIPTQPGPVAFTIDTGNGGQPQKRATLTLDAATAAESKWEPFESFSAGRQLRLWARFVHTGEYYGVIGQTIAGLASLAGALLVWTGLALTLRRFTAWRKRRHRAQELVTS